MVIIEIIQNNPISSILILSLLATIFITIVNFFMVDRTKMKEIKEKQKALRQEVKKYKDNPQKMMEFNKQMIEGMPEQLKHSLKPMIITTIPMLILFVWLRSIFIMTAIASTWIWWYIGSSIIFNICLRKCVGI